jgi:hypothetical protein
VDPTAAPAPVMSVLSRLLRLNILLKRRQRLKVADFQGQGRPSCKDFRAPWVLGGRDEWEVTAEPACTDWWVATLRGFYRTTASARSCQRARQRKLKGIGRDVGGNQVEKRGRRTGRTSSKTWAATGSCGMGGFQSGWCHPGGVGDRGRSVFRGTRRTGMSALLLGV